MEIDGPHERADDAGHEGCNGCIGQHEPKHESASSTANSDGVREGERHYGSETRDDG